MNDLVPQSTGRNRPLSPLEFVDFVETKAGRVSTPTLRNTTIAIERLGLQCRYNVFHDRYTVNGTAFGNGAMQVSDAVSRKLRLVIRDAYKFDPGSANAMDALQAACEANAYHPVLDYLDGLKWDGEPRLDKWLTTYMRAEDTPFTRGVGKLVLVAAVRRMREPGAKFDCVMVLEGPEGGGKSSGLSTLFGPEVFTDQTILGDHVRDKELQEILRGRWCVEMAELAGLKKADLERIKAIITRQTDRARPAYGRAVIEVPRSMVLIGTTNDDQYLRALSGENRRFLPVAVGRVDIAALIRDRDQLWAEACELEEWTYPKLELPEELWQSASGARVDRTQIDPWADVLDDVAEQAARSQASFIAEDVADAIAIYGRGSDRDGGLEERVASAFVIGSALGIATDRQTADMQKRAGLVMRSLGWAGPKVVKINGRSVRAYVRPEPIEALM